MHNVANAVKFLKCVWPFWDVMHKRVKNMRIKKSLTGSLFFVLPNIEQHMTSFVWFVIF